MIETSEILSYLSSEQYLDVKKLEKALKLTKKNERTKLEIAVKALKKLEIISSDEVGHIKLNNNQSLIRAKIRCSSKGYCFAIREDEQEDIYIREHHLNHAWHDDVVLLRLHKEAQRRRSPEGIVQCILERNTSNLVCYLKEVDGKLIADPLDDRIISHIELTSSDKEYLNNDTDENVVEVKVTKYPIAQYKAEGQIVRNLPLDNGSLGDLDFVLTKSNLQLETQCPKFNPKDLSKTNRQDFTDQPCILLSSWQSESAPLLPAIHVNQHEAGTRVWIHTPAISERFTIGGKVHNWLKDRGSSICFGKKWRNILNDELVEVSKFSINQVNEAVSISYDIGKDGKINHWEFFLSRIKPVAEVNQKQIQAIATRKPRARTVPIVLKPISEHINQIQTLIYCCQKLYENRNLDVDIAIDNKIPFKSDLSEFNWDLPANYYQGWNQQLDTSDPNSLIRIITTAAHSIWFFHARKYGINTLSLRSNNIDSSIINEIIKASLTFGINLELDENGKLNPNELFNQIKNESNKRIFNKIIKQAVKNKILFISDNKSNEVITNTKEEFDNSTNLISPWCHPTINYIDIINQNLIVTLLRDGKYKPKSRSDQYANLGEYKSWQNVDWDIFSSSTITQLISSLRFQSTSKLEKQLRNVMSFTNSLISIFKSRKALEIIGSIQEAHITGVQSYGFFAEISPLMIEGLVHVSTLNDDWYEYRSRQIMLIGRKNKKTYQLGDSISVKILKVDLLRNQIDLEVVDDSSIENKIDNNVKSINNDPSVVEIT